MPCEAVSLAAFAVEFTLRTQNANRSRQCCRRELRNALDHSVALELLARFHRGLPILLQVYIDQVQIG